MERRNFIYTIASHRNHPASVCSSLSFGGNGDSKCGGYHCHQKEMWLLPLTANLIIGADVKWRAQLPEHPTVGGSYQSMPKRATLTFSYRMQRRASKVSSKTLDVALRRTTACLTNVGFVGYGVQKNSSPAQPLRLKVRKSQRWTPPHPFRLCGTDGGRKYRLRIRSARFGYESDHPRSLAAQ